MSITKIFKSSVAGHAVSVMAYVFSFSAVSAMAVERTDAPTFGQLAGQSLIHGPSCRPVADDQYCPLLVTNLNSGKVLENRLRGVNLSLQGFDPLHASRWRVARDDLWIVSASPTANSWSPNSCTIHRIPINEVLSGYQDISLSKLIDLRFDRVVGGCDPLGTALSKRSFRSSDALVNYDIIPLHDQACMMILQVGTALSVWRYDFELATETEVRKRPSKYKGTWLKMNEITSPFDGPFHAFVSKERVYLVTAKGEAWRIPTVSGQTALPNLIPESKEDPVRCTILATDSGPAYAFTSKSYFRLEDPIEIQPSPVASNGKDSGEFLLECARLVDSL